MIPRFDLKKSQAKSIAQKLLDKGSGDVDSVEVLKALIELATEKNIEIEFKRIDKHRKKNIIKSVETILDMEKVQFAIENGFDMRPIE